MSELTGINLAMQTPIKSDGSIDYVFNARTLGEALAQQAKGL